MGFKSIPEHVLPGDLQHPSKSVCGVQMSSKLVLTYFRAVCELLAQVIANLTQYEKSSHIAKTNNTL